MSRLLWTWTFFGACLAVLCAAMAWVSATAVRLDRSEAVARQQAALEENARLALWRMDAAVAQLIAQESIRPYFMYSAFYPAERAYTRMYQEIKSGEVLVPSPLLTPNSPEVLLYFQFGPDGELTSPEAPTGNMRDLAETGYTTHERIEAAAQRLAELRKTLNRDALLAHLRWSLVPAAAPPTRREARPQEAQSQAALNVQEFQARGQTYGKLAQQAAPRPLALAAAIKETQEGILKPIWAKGALVLARRVRVDGHEFIQGCWLDWPRIKDLLLAEARALLPAAGLEPVALDPIFPITDKLSRVAPSRKEIGHMMASLPAKLVPGEIPRDGRHGLSPIVLSLIIAWGCVLLAAGAGAWVLASAVSLSERRGAFVSAVTHELRTPLTTFQMYTEMLAGKMVAGEEKRAQYLETLRSEAVRLGHLVENVLAYARLEKGRAAAQVETISLQDLLAGQRERLSARATQAGMQLVIDSGDAWATEVRADASAVEQILFNLVDNACKYAAAAADKSIRIQADRADALAILRVADHGPGISERERRRLFHPFHKSAREAANSAPGVGLGLALSRRLARRMGGDLRLEREPAGGASFALVLPRA